MVVLSAAVCTKQGKPLLSRQFINMPRTRIEGLLAAFGKLIADSADRQHTYIETDSVRYVFQSMETLYLLLITNKASNIVEDLQTLQLISKVVPEYCGGGMISEDVVQKNAFELIFAFDEVISLGYRENVTIQQIRANLEMDSHEETLHNMIEASKMAEAKEEAKKRAAAIKKEQRERAKSGISSKTMVGIGSDSVSSMTGFGSGSVNDSTPDYEEEPEPVRAKPKKRGKGLKLGIKKKKNSFLSKMKKEDGLRDIKTPKAEEEEGEDAAPSGPEEHAGVMVEEKLNISMKSDGSIDVLEVKGTLSIVSHDASCGKIRVQLDPDTVAAAGDAGFQFKSNPNMSKPEFVKNSLLCLKAKNRDFPLGKPTTVLRWRFSSSDDSDVPFTINSWPEPGNKGMMSVNVEYSLEREDLTLQGTQIIIPLGTTSEAPQITSCDVGSYRHNSRAGHLEWTIDYIDASNGTANLEFNIKSDDEEAFFPVQVNFKSKNLISGLAVSNVNLSAGDVPDFKFRVAERLMVDNYVIDYE
jgi:coatomer subunit delta|eukprot:g8388.t1